MKKSFLIILVAVFGLTGFSQQLNYKQKSENSNYYEIVAKTRSELSKRDKSKLSNKKAVKQFERWAYLWKDRVYADGSFPNENLGYFNAGIIDENGKILNLNKNRALQTEITWENIGTQGTPDPNGYPNYPQIGRLNCFLRFPHPTDETQDVLIVGAPTGGVWKSENNGTDWTPILDNVAGIGITDIVSPDTVYSSLTTLYVSTGDYDSDQLKSIGVLKSTDGGATFQSTNLSFSLSEQEVTSNLIVLSEDTVIAGTKHHIYKTTDGGNTWESKLSDTQNEMDYGRFVTSDNNIFCISVWGDIYYSYNRGEDWIQIRIGENAYDKLALFIDDGILKSIDIDGQFAYYNWAEWVDVGNAIPDYEPQQGYDQTLVVENNMIIGGGMNGFHSIDNADTWYQSLNGYWEDASSTGSYIHSDYHNMGFLDNDPSTYKYWACNDGGLSYIEYADENTLKPTITYKSNKCIVTQLYSVAITPNSSEGNMLQGNQDNDGFSREMHNGSMQWVAVEAGDGTATAIDYTNPDIRYLGGTEGALVVTETGFSNNYQGDGDLTIPNANFIWPLEMNTVDPHKLYAGGDDVYLLDMDVGEPTSLNANTGTVSFINTHNNSVFAVGESAVKKSLDGGQNWASVNQASADPSAQINSIDFLGTNPDYVYATCASYIDGDKAFMSDDGGQSWTNISDGLPNVLMKEILIIQNNEQEILYLATELGVYFKIDGNNWERLGGNTLPNVIVNDIDINYTENVLVAATFGRGLWQADISSQLVNVNELSELEIPKIYPNPVKNTIQIELPENISEKEYYIYNVVGGKIKGGKLTKQNNSINLEEIPSGVYMLKIFDNNNYNYTHKIIKK